MQYYAMGVAVPIECFNTLGFLVSQERFHRLGRPFVHVLSADWDLVSLTHFVLVYTKRW